MTKLHPHAATADDDLQRCAITAVSEDDADAGAGSRSTESGDLVISPEATQVSPTPVIVHLADHLGLGDKVGSQTNM